MKQLFFKEPIRFEIHTIHAHDDVWHLEGIFLSGKYEKPRLLRAEPNDEWLKALVIELPGRELREVESAGGNMGRNNFHRPIYTGKLYVMPIEADLVKYSDVKIERSRFVDHRTSCIRSAGVPAGKPPIFKVDSTRVNEMLDIWSITQSERGTVKGREFETRVTKILERLKSNNKIVSFTYHPPNSDEDKRGWDFTVTKNIDLQPTTRHFGVTISDAAYRHHVKAYPDLPQLLATRRLGDLEIEAFIFGLFTRTLREEYDEPMHDEMSRILTKLQHDGRIHGFRYYDVRSEEAKRGVNFVMIKRRAGTTAELSFGVTSMNELFMSFKRAHPEVPQIFMRSGMEQRFYMLKLLELLEKLGGDEE